MKQTANYKEMTVTEQRSISYGELSELCELFNEMTKGHVWTCEEEREECEFDFIDQYINGNDDPQPYFC